ncbi:hypothetical protein RJ639_029450 [Escallonia herrerae]|uniref:Uncharacterized protein n=1 Tax=Escallonia herrerae TaxID=1293975 RepID=A0AA88RTS9_9ASTE|nr:hypothetical protein RJ639_029450 [Escallonia herrerae]
MAVEIFSDNSTMGISPRISFSHDLSQTDVVPVEPLLRSVSSSSADFDFIIHESFHQESSSADELFSDGKLLPTQVKKKLPPQKPDQRQPPPPPPPLITEPDEKHANTKSFWRFKRSSSLNCSSGNGYARSLCPLPLMSRSNSTGSAASSVKRSPSLSKDNSSHKQQQYAQKAHSSSSSYQKPPLKKASYGTYGSKGGGRINPVLNVPSASLFGLGSIFSGGKDKNSKKK